MWLTAEWVLARSPDHDSRDHWWRRALLSHCPRSELPELYMRAAANHWNLCSRHLQRQRHRQSHGHWQRCERHALAKRERLFDIRIVHAKVRIRSSHRNRNLGQLLCLCSCDAQKVISTRNESIKAPKHQENGAVAEASGVPVPRGCRFFLGLGLSVTPSLFAILYAAEASSGLLKVEPRLYRLPSRTILAENLPEVVLLTPSGKSFLRHGAREAPRDEPRRAGSTLFPGMDATGGYSG